MMNRQFVTVTEKITSLVILGVFSVYAVTTMIMFFLLRRDYFMQKRAVGLSLVGAFCNLLIIIRYITRTIFLGDYPCIFNVIVMELAAPMLIICSLLARGLHLFFEYQSNIAKLEEGVENSRVNRRNAMSLNGANGGNSLLLMGSGQSIGNNSFVAASVGRTRQSSIQQHNLSTDDIGIGISSMASSTRRTYSPYLGSHSPMIRSFLPATTTTTTTTATATRKKLSLDDIALLPPNSEYSSYSFPSPPLNSRNLVSKSRSRSRSQIHGSNYVSHSVFIPVNTFENNPVSGINGNVVFSSPGSHSVRRTSIFGQNFGIPPNAYCGKPASIFESSPLRRGVNLLGSQDTVLSSSRRKFSSTDEDANEQTSAQWYKSKRNHVPTFVFVTFIVHVALLISQISLSKMSLGEMSIRCVAQDRLKDFNLWNLPNQILMGIYGLAGLPFLLYKLGPVKDAFGMKSDLLWTIFLGIPVFCVYIFWEKGKSFRKVNEYVPASYLLCLFLIAFHSLIITLPVIQVYRFRRRRKAGSMTPTQSPAHLPLPVGSIGTPRSSRLPRSSLSIVPAFLLDGGVSSGNVCSSIPEHAIRIGTSSSIENGVVQSSLRNASIELNNRRASVFEMVNGINCVEDVFDNVVLLEMFREFAVTEFSVENLFFYEDYRRLKEMISYLHVPPGSITTVLEYDPLLGGEDGFLPNGEHMPVPPDAACTETTMEYFRSHSAPELVCNSLLATLEEEEDEEKEKNDESKENNKFSMVPIVEQAFQLGLESSRTFDYLPPSSINAAANTNGAATKVNEDTILPVISAANASGNVNVASMPISNPKILEFIVLMYKRFIVPGSSHELNLNESTRRPIVEAIERMNSPTSPTQVYPWIFDSAAEEIVILMTSWTLPRFLSKQREIYSFTSNNSNNNNNNTSNHGFNHSSTTAAGSAAANRRTSKNASTSSSS